MAAAEGGGGGGVENPLAAEDANSPPNAGAESAVAVTYKQIDIKAGLKDGSLSSDEAIVLMEEQMEAREKQLRAEMRAEIAAAQLGAAEGGATLISAVRGVVARLTETPTNFHQATVFFGTVLGAWLLGFVGFVLFFTLYW